MEGDEQVVRAIPSPTLSCSILFQLFLRINKAVPIILEEIANKLCFAIYIHLCFSFLGRASRLQISHVVLQYHLDIHYPLAHANMLYLVKTPGHTGLHRRHRYG